jgi:glycosyltransferase involved in cell wall biosynthesis
MNILLITNLYPAYKNQSVKETSYALHDFSKEWKNNNNLIVMRLTYPIYKTFISKRSLYQNLPNTFILDNIKIYNIRMFKFPKIDITFGFNTVLKMLNKLNFYPDIILSHMDDSYIIANKLSNIYKCKFVLGIHNSDLQVIKNKKNLKNLKNCSYIACRSIPIKNRMINYFPEYEKKMIIANSGIDSSDIENHEYFIKKIENWRAKAKIIFITVAVLQKLKNIDTNLEALSLFFDYDWEYFIIGDGEEKKNLQEKANILKINNKVHFLGEKTREEVLAYLKTSDVFIMVSAPETFGLAYLEAMAKGNIVIACKNWGIDGIITDKKNGFLAEARNVEQLSNILQNVFSSTFEEKKRLLCETEQTILANTTKIAAENYLRFIS